MHVFIDIKLYCLSQPEDMQSSWVGYFNQLVNTITILNCTSGYTPGSNGAPRYQCFPDSVSSGKWSLLGGACDGMDNQYHLLIH